MRNNYPGPCYRCAITVAAGEGHFERFRNVWRLQHATCAIENRGTPDPERSHDQLMRMRRAAQGTGRTAQRARRYLRSIEVET